MKLHTQLGTAGRSLEEFYQEHDEPETGGMLTVISLLRNLSMDVEVYTLHSVLTTVLLSQPDYSVCFPQLPVYRPPWAVYMCERSGCSSGIGGGLAATAGFRASL